MKHSDHNADTEYAYTGWAPTQIDTGHAHAARMYNYLLGGHDHYEVDRYAAETVLALMPRAREIACANRDFLNRAVRHLIACGVTQFLDIGIGIPAPGNVVQTAREIAPGARLVGVDNDPIVVTHARALLESPDPSCVAILSGDLRAPEKILADPRLHEVLDLNRPVGVLLVAVLHFIHDSDDPYGCVRMLMDAMPAGSYLALSHVAPDHEETAATAVADIYRQSTATPATLRTRGEILAFFGGLELVDPGLIAQPWWRPDPGSPPADPDANWMYGGLARKIAVRSGP